MNTAAYCPYCGETDWLDIQSVTYRKDGVQDEVRKDSVHIALRCSSDHVWTVIVEKHVNTGGIVMRMPELADEPPAEDYVLSIKRK